VEGVPRLLHHRRTDSGIAAAQAKDFGYPVVAGMEKEKDHGRMHGTGTRVLEMAHVSVVEKRAQGTLLGTEAVLGTKAPAMLRGSMERVMVLCRMRGIARAVLERLP
jgi:hypothetical protein